jgi:hypothetical protein
MSARKDAVVFLGFVALALDLWQAAVHQRTCPKCMGRDYLQVALDVAHLAQIV